ncbi:MAG: hypothetical protein JW764_10310 [Chlorobiaceae bacterium]|nr:hypothetical protein [Chlorobiaceae bacterium]
MHVIENNSSHLCVNFKGSVDQEQLFQALKEIFLHPEYPHKNSIWMFDGCECDFSSISLFDLMEMIKAYYPREATRTKTAIVTSTGTHHAMAKLFCEEAGQEIRRFAMQAFMNHDAAAVWVTES